MTAPTEDFELVEFETIDQVPASGLNRLSVQPRLYDSARWLRYCERAPGTQMCYVGVLDRRQELVGLAAMRLVQDPATMHLYNLGALVADDPATAPEGIYPNLLGAVSGAHCMLLTADDPNRAPDDVVRALISAVAVAAPAISIPIWRHCRAAGGRSGDVSAAASWNPGSRSACCPGPRPWTRPLPTCSCSCGASTVSGDR